MTPDEFRRALNKLSDPQLKEFEGFLREAYGSGADERETYVWLFAKHTEADSELCYALNDRFGFKLKTEEQKNTDAAQTRAVSSKRAIVISIIATGISLLSFGFAVYSVYVVKGGN